jgi:hypothetical protein
MELTRTLSMPFFDGFRGAHLQAPTASFNELMKCWLGNWRDFKNSFRYKASRVVSREQSELRADKVTNHVFSCFLKQFALELLISRYLSATDKGYGVESSVKIARLRTYINIRLIDSKWNFCFSLRLPHSLSGRCFCFLSA